MLGTYWKTWYSLASEQTCTIDYEMDQSLWQTPESIDFKNSSHMWINSIVMWETLQNNAGWGLDSRLRFRRRSWGPPTLLRVEHCAFLEVYTFVPISWMCKKQTSVSHSSTESEVISLDAGYRLDGIPALDLWDLIVLVLGNTTQNHDRTVKPVVCRDKNHVQPHREWLMIWIMLISFPQTSNFHQEALLYVFEDNEAVIKMIIKGRSPTMRHFSRTHRVALDWLFDPINLDPNFKSNILTPKTNSHMCQPRAISHVTNGIIYCVCLISAISVPPIVLKWCRKERKKNHVKRESQQRQNQWWIWLREAVKGLHQLCHLLHQKAGRKPDKKVNVLWVCKLRRTTERWDPLFALKEERTDPLYMHNHQATQNGLLIKFGLRVEIWWNDGW